MRTKLRDPALLEFVRDYMKTYLPKHKCASPQTIATYRIALNQFLTFTAERKGKKLIDLSFPDLERKSLMTFLDDGTENHNWSPTTRNLKLHALRSFLNYVSQLDAGYSSYALGASNIPEQKDFREEQIKYFDIETLGLLLSMPDMKTLLGYRDMLMMAMLFDTGCRASELLNLHLRDVRDLKKEGGVVTVHGKGSKVRNVPLTNSLMEHLRVYIKKMHRNSSSDCFLFYSSHAGTRTGMSEDNLQRIIDKYVIAAKNKYPEFSYEHINPHAFRHARAMYLLKNGIKLDIIASFLGHSNPETTKIYAKVDVTMKKKAIEKAMDEHHPLRKYKDTFKAEMDDDQVRVLFGLK